MERLLLKLVRDQVVIEQLYEVDQDGVLVVGGEVSFHFADEIV